MNLRFSTKFLVVLFLSSSLGATIGYYSAFDHYEFQRLEIQIISDRETTPALYYDIGAGFNAQDVQVGRIENKNTPTIISFCIPYKQPLRAFRFDPCEASCAMTIQSIRLYGNGGEHLDIPLNLITKGQQIKWQDYNDQRYLFETVADATDPHLYIPYIPSSSLTLGPNPFSGLLVLGLLLGALCAFGLRWLFRFFFQGESFLKAFLGAEVW